MITANVIQRVFYLKYGAGYGTCFTIDHNAKQYIVTAKHVIKNMKSIDEVELFHEKKWKKLPVGLIGHDKKSDISVLCTYDYIPGHEMKPSSNNIAIGQDVYFLGFPYGIQGEGLEKLIGGFAAPIVKKGILSSMVVGEGKPTIFLLDAHNNPGFSGGPVVFRPHGDRNKSYQVAGVISGFQGIRQPIFEIKNGEKIEKDLYYDYNTGIVLVVPIEKAIELIQANPNGPEVRKKNES